MSQIIRIIVAASLGLFPGIALAETSGKVLSAYPPDNRPCAVFILQGAPTVLYGIAVSEAAYQERFAVVLTAIATDLTLRVFTDGTIVCGSFSNVTNVGISR